MRILSRHFTKVAKLAILALVMAAMVLVFTACGDNSEKVIKEGIESELASIKDPSSETTAELTASLGDLESMGVNPDEFLTSWLDGYDYTVGKVTVTDQTATVEVSITIKQLGPVIDKFAGDIQILSEDPGNAELTEDQLRAKVGKLFSDTINSAEPTTSSIVLDCVLKDNTWEPADNVESILINALVGESIYM